MNRHDARKKAQTVHLDDEKEKGEDVSGSNDVATPERREDDLPR